MMYSHSLDAAARLVNSSRNTRVEIRGLIDLRSVHGKNFVEVTAEFCSRATYRHFATIYYLPVSYEPTIL